MARYFIEEAKCDVGFGGMGCGPISGPVVAEIKVKTEDEENFYMALAEVEGIPNVVISPISTFTFLCEMDDSIPEEDFEEWLQSDYHEYDDYFNLNEEDDKYVRLYRYLIYLVRADWEAMEEFLDKSQGKWVDEIEVPMCDLEIENPV